MEWTTDHTKVVVAPSMEPKDEVLETIRRQVRSLSMQRKQGSKEERYLKQSKLHTDDTPSSFERRWMFRYHQRRYKKHLRIHGRHSGVPFTCPSPPPSLSEILMHRTSSFGKRCFDEWNRLCIGMTNIDLTRSSVRCLVEYLLEDPSIRGVTSVGCGQGFLEALLTQHMDEVVAIDVHRDVYLTPLARLTLLHPDAQGCDYLRCQCPTNAIPSHHALLFCFPWMDDLDVHCYVNHYRGNRIVILGNASCNPYPQTMIPGFQCERCDVFPYSILDPCPSICVYIRQSNTVCFTNDLPPIV